MRNIVYLSHYAWRDRWHFYQTLALELAKSNRVLYVEPPISPLSLLRASVRRKYPIARLVNSGPLLVQPNLEVYTPLVSPFRRNPWLNRLSILGIIHFLRKWTATMNVTPTVFWAYDLAHLPIIRAFPSSISVYWAGDEVPVPQDTVVDLFTYVFSVSGLVDPDQHPRYRGKVYRMPIAGDFEHYHRALQDPRPAPADIATLPKPIAGYAGSIGRRIDWDLVLHLATRFPNWSFAFVGPVESRTRCDPVSLCRSVPNVHFLGDKSREVAPLYVREFDVGIIPYELSSFNLNCNPVKFYEYCAVGKTVVSVDIPSLRPFVGRISIAHNPEEFATHLEAALAMGFRAEQQAEQVALARQFSPSALAARMESIWSAGSACE